MEMQPFQKRYKEIRALFDGNNPQQSVHEAQITLQDKTLPLYFRLKLLILMACGINDEQEAKKRLNEAEEIWHTVRGTYPTGQDEGVENMLTEVRHSLEHVKMYLNHENARSAEANQSDNPISQSEQLVNSRVTYEDGIDEDEIELTTIPQPEQNAPGSCASHLPARRSIVKSKPQTSTAQEPRCPTSADTEVQRLQSEISELKRQFRDTVAVFEARLGELKHEIAYSRAEMRDEVRGLWVFLLPP